MSQSGTDAILSEAKNLTDAILSEAKNLMDAILSEAKNLMDAILSEGSGFFTGRHIRYFARWAQHDIHEILRPLGSA